MLRCFFLFDTVSFLPFLYWFPSTRQWHVSENIVFIFCIVYMTLRRCNRLWEDCNRYDWEYNWQWGYIVKSYQARMILKIKKQNKSLIPPNGILGRILLLPLTSSKFISGAVHKHLQNTLLPKIISRIHKYTCIIKSTQVTPATDGWYLSKTIKEWQLPSHQIISQPLVSKCQKECQDSSLSSRKENSLGPSSLPFYTGFFKREDLVLVDNMGKEISMCISVHLCQE